MATWCHTRGGTEATFFLTAPWNLQEHPGRGNVPALAPFTRCSADDLCHDDPFWPLPEEANIGWCRLCEI